MFDDVQAKVTNKFVQVKKLEGKVIKKAIGGIKQVASETLQQAKDEYNEHKDDIKAKIDSKRQEIREAATDAI